MALRKTNIIIYLYISLLLFCFCDCQKKKLIKKPGKFKYSNIDLEFRFIESNTNDKIAIRDMKNIKKLVSSVKSLLTSLIYTNLSKKKLTLDQKILDNFELEYNYKEPLIHKKEILNKHLVVLFTFGNLRTKLFKTTVYKANKNSMRNPDKQHIYLSLITINQNKKFKRYIKDINYFKMSLIKEIFYILGFRKPYFKKKKIHTNFDEVPYYLIQNLKSFNSYKKYLSFTNRVYEPVSFRDNGQFYISEWPSKIGIKDIMTSYFDKNSPITELTTNTFNDMEIYSINNCDVLKYKAGFGRGFSCLRPDMKCISEKDLNSKYFMEYVIYKQSWKCYVNTKDNIQKKQCGTLYGSLCNLKLEYRYCPTYLNIKYNYDKNEIPIPEINNYDNVKLRLLKRGKYCPNYFPRNIFFSIPDSIFDEYKRESYTSKIIEEIKSINKDVEYEEITFGANDRKYFVTYEATEENYSRDCVMKVMNNSGVIRSYSNLNSHNLLLKQPFQTITYTKTPKFQKIFSFINFSILSHKDLTYTYYLEMKKKFPDEYNYIAETYFYPEEKDKIQLLLKDYKVTPDDLWLIKPKSGSLGHGIRIFLSMDDIPPEFLLTRYINPPHLINNKKYDFRVYILVTGLAPFRMYIYTEGLVRFASEEYSTDIKDLKENYRHLTNISLNKKNTKSFKVANDVDTEEGNRWSFQAYKEYCNRNNINFDEIFEQMKDNSIKAFISVHKEYYEKIKNKKQESFNFFELHGLDYLPDKNLKLYFLEGNDRPSLIMSDINDRKLKPQLVADMLNIVGIIPYSHEYNDNFKPWEDNENMFPYYYNEKERIRFNVDEALCELGRPRGKFELIFPLKENIDKYSKFFKLNLIENNLFWEHIKKNN